MKLLIHPAIDATRLGQVRDVAGSIVVFNAETREQALSEIVEADAFFGKLTPELLQRAQQLKWV